ncbi:restriction endonuclease [bacterium]|nr:restriction endonuclease [bacterium]MBU1873732.1 restriction endonuclease [bacterium]
MKQGIKFEHLATEVFIMLCKDKEYEKVEHNVILDGPDGPRQIDVLICGKVGPFEAKTIIECKDYNRNVNVTALDALYSKLLDVSAQKAVMVARKGFTNGAKKKARRLGISLCTLHSMEHEKWKFDIEIPILITEFACEKISPSMIFTAVTEKVNFQDFLSVSDIPLWREVAEYWNNNEIECPTAETKHVFIPNIEKPHWVYVPDGRKMEISDLTITMHLTRTYYFGYANDLKSSRYIEFIEKNERKVFFNPNDLSNYREKMTKYRNLEDIPKVVDPLNIKIKLLMQPDMKIKNA